MTFCYLNADNSVIPLDDFQIQTGQSPTKTIPVGGVAAAHRGRPTPDTFRLVSSVTLPNTDDFYVVDEDSRGYACIGSRATMDGGSWVVTGEVTAIHEVARWRATKQGNIGRINYYWRLHRHLDPRVRASYEPEGRCLAFVIDKRYIDGIDGAEYRLAISFGHNILLPETEQGLLRVHVQPGEFVFGLHTIGINRGQVSLLNKWWDTRDAGPRRDAEQGESGARAELDAISDTDYVSYVAADGCDGPIKASSRYSLEDFQIASTSLFDDAI